MKTSPSFRVCRWQPAAVLQVTGEDALTFLQGQFTQELRALSLRQIVYGLWLSQKGKVLADSFVFQREPGVWWLVSYFSPAAVIRERLESYIIADDVAVEDMTDAWTGVALLGVRAGAWLKTKLQCVEPPSGEWTALEKGIVWAGRRGATPGWEWLGPRGAALSMESEAEEISVDELERLRIAGGVPAVPRDVGPGDLPNEAGLERDAISYTKGCYLGQEVMARLKNLGQVRRQLMRVQAVGELPGVLPAPLFLGVKRIGEIRSAVAAHAKSGDDAQSWIGLAMIALLGLPSDAIFSLAPDAPPIVRREPPP
jgi:folate-binding protein YgfZ